MNKRAGNDLYRTAYLVVNCPCFNTIPDNRKETRMNSQMCLWIIPALVVLFSMGGFAPQENQLTPKSLHAALQASPRGAEAEKLAAQVREYFGKDISDLSKGSA